MKVLFVLSNILGNASFSKRIEKVIAEMPEIKGTVFYFEEDDFFLPYPFWLPGSYSASYICRTKFDALKIPNDFDVIFFQSIHLMLGFGDWIKKTPTIVSHDQTPASSFRLITLENPSFTNKLTVFIKNIIAKIVYGPVMRNVDVFMPWTQSCADSLINDYKINKNNIVKSPGYIDLVQWAPKSAPDRFSRKKLLFVGNDFQRKGGYFLLELFSKYLQDSFELSIVTNDPCVDSISLPPHVQIHKGINSPEKLLDIYNASSLFVFPTKREQMGIVLVEAAATGLPVIATDNGGISEVVKNGKTGTLMPYTSSAEEWANEIKDIFNSPHKLTSQSKAAREFAQEFFSEDAYKNLLAQAFNIALNPDLSGRNI